MMVLRKKQHRKCRVYFYEKGKFSYPFSL